MLSIARGALAARFAAVAAGHGEGTLAPAAGALARTLGRRGSSGPLLAPGLRHRKAVFQSVTRCSAVACLALSLAPLVQRGRLFCESSLLKRAAINLKVESRLLMQLVQSVADKRMRRRQSGRLQ